MSTADKSTIRPPLWAKRPERLDDGLAPYPIDAHLLDTVVCAMAVWDHYLTARLRRLIAEALADGDEECARSWIALAAGLHDCGKSTYAFQRRLWLHRGSPSWADALGKHLEQAGMPVPNTIALTNLSQACGDSPLRRHEVLGMGLLAGKRAAAFPNLSCTDSWLPLVVGGHHGAWHNLPIPKADVIDSVLSDARSGPWGEEVQRLVDLVAATCGVHPQDAPSLSRENAGVVTVLITGIVQLADWLASDDRIVDEGLALLDDAVADSTSPAWAQYREGRLTDHVRHSLGQYIAPEDRRRVALAIPEDQQVPPSRPLQVDAESVGDGLWFVAYPTAEGKTGAALLRHMAEDDEGLIFALPTRATTDAMQGRLERSFSGTENSVLLSHQYASLHRRPETAGHGFDWYTTATRRLLAPVVAATCDQVLAGALPQRHSPLRLLALANHHVVLDEVHTYDQFQTRLLSSLMAWWGATGTRVTVLSATMPQWQQQELAQAYVRSDASTNPHYPAHWLVTPSGTESRQAPPLTAPVPDVAVRVTAADDATAVHREWARDQHDRFPRCSLGIIRSTVDETIATADGLRTDLPDDIDLRVLHSRMTLAHRAEVEAELLARLGRDAPPGRPLAVVGTQVLDVSLELSFWLMSSDLAPAASLIQRAGRLWRFLEHMERNLSPTDTRPQARDLHVVSRTVDGGIAQKSSWPYFASELQRVADWLGDERLVRIPEDVQEFVDHTSADLARIFRDDRGASEIADLLRRHENAEELGKQLTKLVRAKRAARHVDLAGITSTDPLLDDLELATRYTTTESATFLLIGGKFGACASLGELQRTTDLEIVRDSLRGIVPVSGAMFHQLSAVSGGMRPPWNPDHALLTHLRPLDADRLSEHGFTYDSTFGLMSLAQEGAQ